MSHKHPFQTLHFVIENSLDAVAKTTEELFNYIRKNQITSEEEAQNIQLALIEIVTNAVEHGNLEISSDSLTFTIHDEGPGFDHSQVLKTLDKSSLDQLSKRGIFLTMKKCIDKMYYNEKGNVATLVKKL